MKRLIQIFYVVIPAKAGIQVLFKTCGRVWIPAFAGMTEYTYTARRGGIIFMIIHPSENKTIHIDPAAEREIIEIQEQGSATIYIGANKTLRLDVVLAGTDASVKIIGRFLGINRDIQEIIVRAVMQAPRTDCHIDFRTALDGASSSFFDGLIHVEEGAKNARGFLSYRGLLLSPNARAKPIPRLEVLTKEVVSLGHAASVGKIDAEQLFYLQSRGLSGKEAEKIIVEGFLGGEIMA